jgi:predicted MFS family arabinose efflux permease
MFAAMALLLAVTLPPVLALREPWRASGPTFTALQLSYGWATRLFAPGMLSFIGLIFLYRYGDQIVTSLLGPFLSDYGLSKETIAIMKGTVGSATSLVGALIGGWLAFSAGRRTAVLASGVAQAACFILYIAAAYGAGGVGLLWIATILEGVVGTMATVALFTLMMDASDPEHAGTDYTLFASVIVLVSAIGNFSGAAIADEFGYGPTFIVGAVLALAGCLAVVWSLDRRAAPARVAEVWSPGGGARSAEKQT